MFDQFGRVFLMILFIVILFNYIKKDDYLSIAGLLIVILFIDKKMNQKNIEYFGSCIGTQEISGEECSVGFNIDDYQNVQEAENACNIVSGCSFTPTTNVDDDVDDDQVAANTEDDVDDDQVAANTEDDVDDVDDQVAANTEDDVDDVDDQVAANTEDDVDDDSVISSNNAQNNSEEDTIEEKVLDKSDDNVDLNNLPSSKKEDFKQTKDIIVKDHKFRVGPYDSLCLTGDKYKDPGYVQNDVLKTYFGVQGPVQVVSSQPSDNIGPTIDGDKDSPQKLSMFSNNKTSFNCCHESPYMSSTGCVCLTEKQREYIRTRGFNNVGSTGNL